MDAGSSEADALLASCKSAVLEFDSIPPLNSASPNATQERIVARTFFEGAVLYALRAGDNANLHRYLAQLRPYYSDFGPPVSSSTLRGALTGLNLLALLADNALSDFHSELELVSSELIADVHVTFALRIERALAVGAYDDVLSAARAPPSPLFAPLLTALVSTARAQIAECAEAAYTSLSASAARDLLLLSSDAEAMQFFNERGWVLQQERIVFARTSAGGEREAKREGLPALRLVSETLGMATELDRIV